LDSQDKVGGMETGAREEISGGPEIGGVNVKVCASSLLQVRACVLWSTAFSPWFLSAITVTQVLPSLYVTWNFPRARARMTVMKRSPSELAVTVPTD